MIRRQAMFQKPLRELTTTASSVWLKLKREFTTLDVVQRGEFHESRCASRFPRIVRIRDDKPPSDIDTLSNVDEI